MKAEDLFNDDERSRIIAEIKEAEKQTSGEIRLFIENHCQDDVLDRAAFIFKELEIHKTDLRNGVLFYLAVKDHKFAILGDAGINHAVPPGFWDAIKETMRAHFKNGDFEKGLSEGIQMAGLALREHFPFNSSGDKNELSDDIVFR